MISQIQIQNFQSHKETLLDLCQGVNVIVGKSNSGKTAIVRALRWLISNRPLGFRFNSQFSDDSTRAGIVIDNHKIEHEKTEKGSVYRFDQEEWGGIGTDIPDKIRQFLNIGELNFSDQLDVPFLITSSPGEVGRALNRIMQLDTVDEWVSSLTTMINSEKKEITFLNTQIEELAKLIKDLDFIPELEKKVVELEQLNAKIQERKKEREELTKILAEVEINVEEIKELEKWLEVEKEVENIEKICKKLSGGVEELGYIEEFLSIQEKIKEEEDFLQIEHKFKELENCWQLFAVAQDEVEELDLVVNKLEVLDEQKNRLEQDLSLKRSEFVMELKKLGKCLFCFSPLDGERIEQIVKELEI